MNLQNEEYVQDPRNLFLYRWNHNDPINQIQRQSTNNYMTELSDWLEFFNIKSPRQYFNDENGIFSQITMEHDIQFDYGRSRRRPKLWTRIKTEPQLFGPNIVFSVGTYNTLNTHSKVWLYPIASSVLQGGGTVEQIIARLLNGSHYLSSEQNNIEDPLKLVFIVSEPITMLEADEEAILFKSLLNFHKHTIQVKSLESQKHFIEFQVKHCKVTFWFGIDVYSSSSSDVLSSILRRPNL